MPGKELLVQVLSKEEFVSLNGEFPYRSRLIDSMEGVLCCRIEVYAACVFGVLRIPDKNRLEGEPKILGFYVRENSLIFIGTETSLESVLSAKGEMQSEMQILLEVFHKLIEQEIPYLQKFEEEITELENSLLKRTAKEVPRMLMCLRKDIMRLRSYYMQIIDIGEEIKGRNSQLITKEQAEEWGVFASRVSKLCGYTENMRENILQLYELYQSQIELQQNETMKVLTAVTAVFLPLSLLTGWYGMNFSDMLLLNRDNGYFIVIVITAAIMIAEILYFCRKGFLKKRK